VKIIYYLGSEDQLRVVSALKPIDGVEQIAIYQRRNSLYGAGEFVCKIPKKSMPNKKNMMRFIRLAKPDIVVACNADVGLLNKSIGNFKVAFVSHGIWFPDFEVTSNVLDTTRTFLEACDLIFVGSDSCKDVIKSKYKGVENKIVTNALPQLDLLHDVRSTKRNSILFCTHKQGKEFYKDYDVLARNVFDSIPEISQAKKWHFVVKPKKTKGKRKKTNINIIDGHRSVYSYFNSRAIICSAMSSLYVEACLARMPLGILCSENTKPQDYFGLTDFGAYVPIRTDSIDYMLKDIEKLLSINIAKKQMAFCKHIGISSDIKHGDTMQKSIMNIIKK
jgi:hypothetical protein